MVVGDSISVQRKDSAFRAQALFPFGATTAWGSKVDKYDCRALLSGSITYSTTQIPNTTHPDQSLQLARFSALLLHIAEGSTQIDILEWCKTHYGLRKTQAPRFISPTQFELDKLQHLTSLPSPAELNAPSTSTSRLNNLQLDNLALSSGIHSFCRLVHREDTEHAVEGSHAHSAASSSNRKRRTNGHVEDSASGKHQQEGGTTIERPEIEIEISRPEDSITILEDHWSKNHPNHNGATPALGIPREQRLKRRTWQESEEDSDSSTDSLGRVKPRAIQHPRPIDFTPTPQSSTPSKQAYGNPTNEKSRQTSPGPSDRTSRRSPERADRKGSHSPPTYQDRRRYDDSPPHKRVKRPESKNSSSKLDSMLASLEAKHQSKR